MALTNKYIIVYGSFTDGVQGYIGVFDSEDEAEEYWERCKTKNYGWEMNIEELLNKDNPKSEKHKFFDQ